MLKNVLTTFVNAMLCYATKYTLVCTYEIARITPPRFLLNKVENICSDSPYCALTAGIAPLSISL